METHIYDGYRIPPHYDSMIAKLIAHGETRTLALARMSTALSELVIEGISTNIPVLQRLLDDAAFIAGAPISTTSKTSLVSSKDYPGRHVYRLSIL